MQESQLRVFKNHAPCPKCGSKDNVAVYADGYEKCFTPGCSYYKYQNTSELCSINTIEKKQNLFTFDPITAKAIPERGIEIATVLDFNHIQADHNGQNVMVSTYVDQKGAPVCQKIRFPNKEFRTLGDSKAAMPYGYHLWKANQKAVLICEGEEDTMSIHQVMGSQIAVAGVPFGAGPQTQHFLKKNLEIFNQFNTIYLGFDNDDAGRLASKEAAELFANKKVRVISWRNKDANNSLQLGRPKEIEDAIWQAKVSTPDDIIELSDISLEDIENSCKPGIPLSVFPKLEQKLKWLKQGAIYTIAAAPKIGKSSMTRALALDLVERGYKVGCLYLEEDQISAAKEFIALKCGLPVWRIDSELKKLGGPSFLKEQLEAFKGSGLTLWSHKGNFTPDKVVATMRSMRKSLDCDVVILDNLSLSTSTFGDDLSATNKVIADIVKICQETGLCLVNVVHLKKNVGTDSSGEDIPTVTPSMIYGTGALNKFSTALIALEKVPNQQAAVIKVLSNRTTGMDGYCDTLTYDPNTGKLLIKNHQPEILIDLDV